MSAPLPMVLCPVCRIPILDRDYYAHAQKHQKAKGGRDIRLPTDGEKR